MGGTTHTLRPSPNLLLYYFRLGGLLSRFLLCFISVHQCYVSMKLISRSKLDNGQPWGFLRQPTPIPIKTVTISLLHVLSTPFSFPSIIYMLLTLIVSRTCVFLSLSFLSWTCIHHQLSIHSFTLLQVQVYKDCQYMDKHQWKFWLMLHLSSW